MYKPVLITGASSGIGEAAAVHLAHEGFRVFAAARDPKKLDGLSGLGEGRITPVKMDVADEASISDAFAEIAAAGAALYGLVNNAGISVTGPVEQVALEDWRRQYETNVFGVANVIRAALPQMREAGAGRIVMIGSVAGRIASPFMGAYASSKHAVEGLSDSLRRELRQAEAERGRTEWVTDECQRLVDKALADPDPDTAWWRIKEARRLKGRAAAVAQEVAKWREAQARADDRPVRTVLPDLALASIAQRPPKDERALGKIRGLRERGLAKSHRAGLLQAVADGLALDLDAVRTKTTVAVPSEYRPAVPLLMSWVSQRARQLDLDPAVLATRNDLEDFLRGDEDGRLATGWRRTALADDLDALLSGRGSLAFEPGTGLVMRLGD